MDRRGNFGLQLRQFGLDAVHGFDDVRAGLAEDEHQNRGRKVGVAGVAHILHRIGDRGHIVQPHRRAIAVGHHQRAVLAGLEQLIVGADRTRLQSRPVKSPLGRLALAAPSIASHIFQAQTVMIQQRGIHVHAHARQRAAAYAHLPDASKLRKSLHDDGRRDIVDLAGRDESWCQATE